MKNLKVISNRNEFDAFLEEVVNSIIWIYPILSDVNAHPAANRLSALIAFTGNNAYLLAFHHNDGPRLPVNWIREIKGNLLILPNKKDWLYLQNGSDSLCDTQMYEYLMFGLTSEWLVPQICNEMRGRFRDHKNVNDVIPIMKLLEEAENWVSHSLRYMSGFQEHLIDYFFKDLSTSLYFIESSGLKIDEDEFLKHFKKAEKHIHSGFVYSQYHPYHVTGRPSNSFGDINFAAIPKKDGSRRSFISRFGVDGKLVLIDFESFHLRLIAQLVHWTQPHEPFHEYLAKEYYGKTVISKEEYESGKLLTFKNLYSDERAPTDIPFFHAVYQYIDNLWETVQKIGSFETCLTHRRISMSSIDLPTKAKIFNYYIQSMESEVAFNAINKLRSIYNGVQSKIILYTYDSILIDFCIKDGAKLLNDTVHILENGGTSARFPTRIYAGDNYHDMEKLGE